MWCQNENHIFNQGNSCERPPQAGSSKSFKHKHWLLLMCILVTYRIRLHRSLLSLQHRKHLSMFCSNVTHWRTACRTIWARECSILLCFPPVFLCLLSSPSMPFPPHLPCISFISPAPFLSAPFLLFCFVSSFSTPVLLRLSSPAPRALV